MAAGASVTPPRQQIQSVRRRLPSARKVTPNDVNVCWRLLSAPRSPSRADARRGAAAVSQHNLQRPLPEAALPYLREENQIIDLHQMRRPYLKLRMNAGVRRSQAIWLFARPAGFPRQCARPHWDSGWTAQTALKWALLYPFEVKPRDNAVDVLIDVESLRALLMPRVIP